ncbi:MAG: mechanosensitive ion channel [Vicingaceae bacterium]
MEDIDIQGAYHLITDKLENWLETLIAMLPNLALAVVILISFYFLARIVKNIVGKMMHRVSGNLSLNHLVENIMYFTVIVIGSFIALDVLELEKTVTSLLAGVGVLGLALGFAFQDTAANFVSGIFLAVRSPINSGDIVKIDDVMGVVQKISLRATEINTFQGTLVVIPNKDVFQNPIFNYTHTGKRRVDLACGISYGDKLDKVKEVSLKAIENTEGVLKDQPIQFFYKEFGSSSINFEVRAWIEQIDQKGFLETQSNMIVALKKAFDENDIMIPFPIRTLDFGIKGGEKLKEMLDHTE